MLPSLDLNDIALCQLGAWPAIENQRGRVLVGDDQLDGRFLRNHQRRTDRGVARNRHQREALHPRGEDRPAGGHAIGCRAARRRDNHAVAGVHVDEVAVEVQLDFDHPVAAADDDVIDRPAFVMVHIAAPKRRLERRAGFDRDIARHQRVERLAPVLLLDQRQEPDLAEVDAQQGRIRVGVRGAHHQAVSAKDDDGRDAIDAVVVQLLLGHGMDATVLEPVGDLRREGVRLGLAPGGDDADLVCHSVLPHDGSVVAHGGVR